MKTLIHSILCFFSFTIFLSCEISSPKPARVDTMANVVVYAPPKDSIPELVVESPADNTVPSNDTVIPIKTGKTKPDELMRFAETLIGTPYVWAASDPQVGFDCSGFITYVFSHFNISVPRSSIDFLNVGKTVKMEEAKRGDFILFTGTDPMETNIGHMGLVVSNNTEGLHFIHSTSGKAMSVTISPLNEQYKKRFVRISRVF